MVQAPDGKAIIVNDGIGGIGIVEGALSRQHQLFGIGKQPGVDKTLESVFIGVDAIAGIQLFQLLGQLTCGQYETLCHKKSSTLIKVNMGYCY